MKNKDHENKQKPTANIPAVAPLLCRVPSLFSCFPSQPNPHEFPSFLSCSLESPLLPSSVYGLYISFPVVRFQPSLYHSFLYFVSFLFFFFFFSVLPSLSFVQDAFVEILPEIPRLLFWKVLLPNHACGLSFISWLWRISKEIGKSDQNQRMGMGIWGCGCAWRFSMHHSSLFQ